MPRTGLYFGSFNPVHIGHIAIAGYMVEFTGIDNVWFVVSPHNPLKKKETLLDDNQRLHMVRLAVGDNDHLRASDIEFRLPAPSFTIDTLAHLSEKHPTHEFCVIMGEDNLYTLHKWKNVEELVNRYSFYIYPRREAIRPDNRDLDRIISSADINMVNAPQIDISSTFIRNGIKAGKNMSYFVPAEVWKYIQEMHFYEK